MKPSRELNWVSPKVRFGASELNGTGAFAQQDIAEGETLVIFGGYIIPISEFESLPEPLKPFTYQISKDFLFGPGSIEQLSPCECWNHSCDPNAGFSSETTLVAIRSISAGEEITFDYATCMDTDLVNMPCNCGSFRCRKQVAAEDWRLVDLQIRYRRHFQPYLQKEIGFGVLWHLKALAFKLSNYFASSKSHSKSRPMRAGDQAIETKANGSLKLSSRTSIRF